MTGIYDCFGYGSGYDVSFEERYKLIRKSGFDCVMLWWSNQFGRGDGYQEDVRLARRAGLFVENIHAPVHEQNNLSLDNLSGEGVFQSYLQCVADCCEYDIPTMVIHLPNDNNPLNQTGIRRLAELINKAEQKNIQIAFENLSNIKNLKIVLNKFTSNNVGYCYDSCHHINYAPDEDLLGMYGNRLMAIHLQDNGGSHNQHQLPFDGNINWDTVMEKIACTGYRGATTLEPMNWDYSHLNICQFLELAYEREFYRTAILPSHFRHYFRFPLIPPFPLSSTDVADAAYTWCGYLLRHNRNYAITGIATERWAHGQLQSQAGSRRSHRLRQ